MPLYVLYFVGEEATSTFRRITVDVICPLSASACLQDLFSDALRHAEEAFELSRDTLGPNDVTTLEALRSIAVCYEVMQEYTKALTYYQQVRNIRGKSCEHASKIGQTTGFLHRPIAVELTLFSCADRWLKRKRR